MTATLKKNVIGLVISILLFSVSIILIYNMYSETERYDVMEAELIIDNVTVDKNYNTLIQWSCSNTPLTSYQVYSLDENNSKHYETSTLMTRRYYRAPTKAGGLFTYTIRAYNSDIEDGKASEFSPYISVYIDSSKPAISITDFVPVLAYGNDNGKVRLEWETPVNCPVSSYCLYRKNDAGGWEVAKVLSPYATEYTDDRSSGVYKMVARITLNGELQSSQPSEIIFAEVDDE